MPSRAPYARTRPGLRVGGAVRARRGGRGIGGLEYPADYHEQWIDVTGLQGRFVFVQRVGPRNAIRESDETNNVSPRITLRLPPPGPRKPARGRLGY